MYFYTPAERTVWVMADIRHQLTYGIAYNPRGAYNVIKAAYPDYKNLEQGTEAVQGEQNAMYEFLLQQAMRSGNPAQYAANFLAQVKPTPTSHLTFLKTA